MGAVQELRLREVDSPSGITQMSLELEDTDLESFQSCCVGQSSRPFEIIPTINNYYKPLPRAADSERNQPQGLSYWGQTASRTFTFIVLFGARAMSEMCAGQGEEAGTYSQW